MYASNVMLLTRSGRFWCILGCLIEDGCNDQEGWKNPKMVIVGGGGQKMYQNGTENAMVSYSFYLQASIFPMKFVTSYLKKFIGGGGE